MNWLLKLIPTEVILRWVAKKLTGLDDKAIDLVIQKVEQIDKENIPGFEKRQKVYEQLRQSLDNVADWAINFLIELAIAYLKKKKS